MKVTRELIDNGKQIVHINYEKSDIKEVLKKIKENSEKEKQDDK